MATIGSQPIRLVVSTQSKIKLPNKSCNRDCLSWLGDCYFYSLFRKQMLMAVGFELSTFFWGKSVYIWVVDIWVFVLEMLDLALRTCLLMVLSNEIEVSRDLPLLSCANPVKLDDGHLFLFCPYNDGHFLHHAIACITREQRQRQLQLARAASHASWPLARVQGCGCCDSAVIVAGVLAWNQRQ